VAEPVTAHLHRTTGISAFIVCALYNALALAWYDAQALTHRARQFRPVCTLYGHAFDVTLTDCVRCGAGYNRVRDCGRPR
jgi:hypothetical protein